MIKEEQLKITINNLLAEANKEGLTVGSIYYILKDTFNEFEKTYFNYVNNAIKQQQEEEKQEEEE